ncbi:toxin-antitoxin system HicB family antitoxin [Pseudonocardia kunmingensis]|uniref:HicB-like protein involved in pilus formation n=1 Tax=Pseudonocardia kunmingensis TaxID=630975 RepID=A0A543DXI6_9PSEU|nr:toxin-antitoxin system HicB family antitoxin [Pseudonocardia kunmingensis]TQM14026.1 HicB-like protein involved in pilus formation [Pseudonocardia kunmingensis]
MKQLIARIDDDLHRRLKQCAAEQDRSLNDLVAGVLAAAVEDDAQSVRRRIDRSGLRVLPPRPVTARPRQEVLAGLEGLGTPVSDALAADRDAR